MKLLNGRNVRGAMMVREVVAEEHRAMQARAYKRVRPYLVGALGRLRAEHPGFKTVVFSAQLQGFSLIFVDGTWPHEAPKPFRGLKAACEELAKLSEIEEITAADPLWQVIQGTPQPEFSIEQYRHVADEDWNHWQRRPLSEARYYMRQAM